MDQGLAARIIAAVVAIGAFTYGATQGDLINLGAGLGAAVVASVGIYIMPPVSTGFAKLRDHLLLSVPIAGLSVVSGAVILYTDASGIDVANLMALILGLLVPASILEQRLKASGG
jgi:hypothetical protein